MRPTLDQYLMSLAMVAATHTTCIRKGVGCVLADSRGRILAVAYNGVAAGQPHCNEVTGFQFVYANGLDEKRPLTGQSTGTEDVFGNACDGAHKPFGEPTGCEAVHAEQNAIVQCRDIDAIATAYVTTAPCKPCMKLLMNTGCRRIVFAEEHTDVAEVEAMWTKTGRTWEQVDA